MRLNKHQRQMIYQLAITIQNDRPNDQSKWSNHTCIEQAFIKCAGFKQYDESIESMFPEYRKNPKAELNSYLK